MLKRQHVFIRSSLAFTTIDDSPAFLSKLQTPLFAALLSKISKHLNLLRMVLSYFGQSVILKALLQVGKKYAFV